MEHAKVNSKEIWFVNPYFDILLLTSFPIILILIFFLYYLHSHNQAVLAFLNSYWFTRFMRPHFVLTLGAVYLDKQELKGNDFQFIYLPIFLILVLVFLSIAADFNICSTVFFYWIVWHILFQNYYILQLHKLRNGEYSFFDKAIDFSALIIGPIYAVLKIVPSLELKYTYGAVYRIPISPYFLFFLKVLAILSLMVFIGRQIFRFIKFKEVKIFKIMIVSMTNLSFYFSLIVFANFIIFFMSVFRWHHNIQYIAWMLFYHRNKFRSGILNGSKIMSFLAQPGKSILYIMTFSVFGWIVAVAVQGVASFNVRPEYASGVMLSIIAFLHVYFDAIIWRIPKVHRIIDA